MDEIIHIYFSSGNYLGFIKNDSLFSRDGDYIGWLEQGKYVWDSQGRFRGVLAKINNQFYVLRDRFSVSPIPKSPRIQTEKIAPPPPQPPIPPIDLSPTLVDAFSPGAVTK